MNIFYEEEGSFKVGAILADNDTSLQVEAPHGKRSKACLCRDLPSKASTRSNMNAA